MIKFQVDNMSCGSCRVKVKAELENKGFKNIHIDVNDNYVTIEGKTTKKDVIDILKNIKYKVDESTYMEYITFPFWDDILLEEEYMDLFNKYLEENDIRITDFDEENIEFILQAKQTDFENLKVYLENIK